MQAVMMAGGKGTRLQSVTRDEIPKPMAPILDKPILVWQIEALAENGVRDIVLVVGHLGEKIRQYFGDGSALGVRIRYIEETEPLGTAGSLYHVRRLLDDGTFVLLFGDVIFSVDLSRMLRAHQKKNARCTLFVHPNSHPDDSDLVLTGEEDRVVGFDAKHSDRSSYWYDNCVNAGLYLMEKNVCEEVRAPARMDLEKDLLSAMIAREEAVYAYRSPEYIKDVGTVDRIRDCARELSRGHVAARNLRKRQRAVFLDRDGTINRKNGLIFREDQFILEDCAAAAIRMINASDYLAIVATNQPVVARGLCSVSDVLTIHNKMKTLLGRQGAYVDAVQFCPHHPHGGYPEENPAYKTVCRCRKPEIGMLSDCAERYNIDLSASWFVGDSTVDVKTGQNAGTRTALVRTGDAGLDGKYSVRPDLVCADLLDAVKKITEV